MARIDGLKAESAGLAPGGQISAHSVAVASRRVGADLSTHVPRSVGGIDLSRFDLVVALDGTVGARLAGEVDDGHLKVWDVADPVGGPLSAYERAADQIELHLKDMST
jgi:protein-tyrosine-phosphatase